MFSVRKNRELKIARGYLCNGLTRPVDYSIFAGESMMAQEWTCPTLTRGWPMARSRALSVGSVLARDGQTSGQRDRQGKNIMPALQVVLCITSDIQWRVNCLSVIFFASGERQWRTGAAAVSFYQLDGHLQQVAAAVG